MLASLNINNYYHPRSWDISCPSGMAELDQDVMMLQGMLQSNTSQTTPLLVLSCQQSGEDPHDPPPPLPPVEVATRLRLCDLEHPWQVHSLSLSLPPSLSRRHQCQL